MKRPYRYFRSELNGFYLRALTVMANIAVEDIIDEFIYHATVSYDSDAFREADIYNIGAIAGYSNLHIYGLYNTGSIMFSKSHIVNGAERSERGLYDMYLEQMAYQRTTRENYSGDIANIATERHRMGLIPDGMQPVGYVLSDTPVYDAEGNIITENILSEPPTDGTPYTPLYSNKFLTLENLLYRDNFLSVSLFKSLFESLQYLRHNALSISKFLEVARTLCDKYVCDVDIKCMGRYFLVRYRLDTNIDLPNRTIRYNAWLYICDKVFKLFKLQEVQD